MTVETSNVAGVLASPGSVLVTAVVTAPFESSVDANSVMEVINGDVTEGQILTDGQTTLDVRDSITAYGK